MIVCRARPCPARPGLAAAAPGHDDDSDALPPLQDRQPAGCSVLQRAAARRSAPPASHAAAALAEGQRFCTACGSEAPRPAATATSGERRHATVMFSDLSGYTALNEALDPEEVEAVMVAHQGRRDGDRRAPRRHRQPVRRRRGHGALRRAAGAPSRRAQRGRAPRWSSTARSTPSSRRSPTGSARSLSMHTGIQSGLVVARTQRRARRRLRADRRHREHRRAAARARGAGRDRRRRVDAGARCPTSSTPKPASPAEVKGKEQPLVAVRIRGERDAPVAGGGAARRARRGVARVPRRRRGVRRTQARPRHRRARRSWRRQVAPGRRVRRDRDGARLLVPLRGGARLRLRDRSRRDAQPRAEPARPCRDGRRRRAPARRSRARAAERALAAEQRLFLHDLLEVAPPLGSARARRGDEHGGARARLARRALRARDRRRGERAAATSRSRTSTGPTRGRSSASAALAALAARQPLLLVMMTTRFAGDPTAGAWRTRAARRAAARHRPRAARRRRRAPSRRRSPRRSRRSIVASCVARAEGNPLFLLQLLLDVGEAAQASLPGSIQALVHTRMDRLAAADKAALQAAAVLGQRFALDALRHLIEQPGVRLPRAGRALPRPPGRRRVHVLPRADPRRRVRVAAARASAPAARARRRMVRGARRSLSPPSTSTAPRMTRGARRTSRLATRSPRSSATRRR